MPLITLPPKLYPLCQAIKDANGRAYLAGGIVRDSVLGVASKDIDLEIHDIEQQALVRILYRFGKPNFVGQSFPVWILRLDNHHIDISLTDAESTKEACRRRDLRINAMLYDPLTDEIVDPFGGMEDIQNKQLTATDPLCFAEDPLRVLRVAQFSARFQFEIATSLRELCLQLPLQQLPEERILLEFEKAWLKPTKPSIAFQELVRLRVIEKYFGAWPGLDERAILEGLDRGKRYCTEHNGWNMALFWGISLHRCTKEESEHILDRLQIYSYLNYPIRKGVLASLHCSPRLMEEDSSLLRNQCAEYFFLHFLCTIAMSIQPDGCGQVNLEKATLSGIANSPLPRLIQGRDILPFGLKGREIGRCLSFIRERELDETIQNRAQGLAAVAKWLHKQKEKR